MKKLIVAFGAAALIGTPAIAGPSDSDEVTVNATVEKECSIEDVTVLNLGALPIVETPGLDALQLTDTETRAEQLAWVSCNFTNRMTLSAPTPLTSASGAALLGTTEVGSQPFVNEIDYRFRANNYRRSPESRSDGGPSRTFDETGPIHKNIRFRAYVLGSDNSGVRPVAADDYTATATIEITTL
ncbi:hypothetical protein [uncultured Erythrobacter sp.]|uniref:hypothetical protein n=1 Tax=uncultured Erythrobacter sp. TaxID=263913 RepID=UPI002610D668|nr:hypothetical protein [uncultured Erythrobacter sp.]